MLDRAGWLAFVLAVVPALVRLPRTRSLLRHIDDPTLPERMTGSRNLIAFAFSSVATLDLLLWPRLAVWTMPLLIVTFALAGWPLRRALFAETWSFGSYLWFYVRLCLAIYGFWIAVIASLWITDLGGLRGWAAAAVWGAVLLVWNERYGGVIRFILRARPVTTPSLVDRFRDIIAKTTVNPPNVEFVDMRGGAFVNALALPAAKKPSVLFTSTLLERFDDDEVTAIFAHEVAHLEHYNPAYLQRRRWLGWLLILATVTITPLVNTVAPAFGPYVMWWPIVVLAHIIILSGHKQKHETESDLRAVALTGAPEVMVRALTKLHEMMKLPRRLDPSVEVNASHPSLARRIQAIRAAGGAPPAALAEALTFRHDTTAVTLHSDRLIWAEGDVTAYTLAYSALDELRIEADAKGALRLVASDPAGRKWTMPLAKDDVARAHAALNLVDTQLRPSPTGASKWVAFGRIAAMLCAVAALGALQFASLLIAAFAAVSFERPLVRAAGMAGLAGGFLALRDGPVSEFGWILILAAVLLLFIDYRDQREVVSRATWRLVAGLGVFALLSLVPIAFAGGDLLETHQAARTWPGGVVFALAFAIATMSRPAAAWKAAAVTAVAIGGALVALSSTATLDALLDDPFLTHLPAARTLPIPAVADSRFEVGLIPEDILLSPNGLAIAAVTQDDYEEYVFHVGRPGQLLTEARADTALFVDDDRLLMSKGDRNTTQLRLIHVDRPDQPIWEKSIAMSEATISIAGEVNTWQLLGTAESGAFVRVAGSVDGGAGERREWTLGETTEPIDVVPIAAEDDRVLLRQTSYDRVGLNLGGSWRTWQSWIDPWRTTHRFIQVDDRGPRDLLRSQLDVDCMRSPVGGDAALCWGYDGSRTHVFRMNVDAELTPLAQVPGRISVDFTRGWATGWGNRGLPYALNVATGDVYVLEPGKGFLVAGGPFIGVVSTRGQSADVTLYRISAR